MLLSGFMAIVWRLAIKIAGVTPDESQRNGKAILAYLEFEGVNQNAA
jgi:hypothetical protein